MSERPTTVEEWEAAVRQVEQNHRAAARVLSEQITGSGHVPSGAFDLWLRERAVHQQAAYDLAALLLPAKERVPWWEAKGRTVDGREVVSLHHWGDGNDPSVNVAADPLDPARQRAVAADPDGMVEVDAR